MNTSDEIALINAINILSKRRLEPISCLFDNTTVESFVVDFNTSGIEVRADNTTISFEIGDTTILSLEAKRIIESSIFYTIDFKRSLLSQINLYTVNRTPVKTLVDFIKPVDEAWIANGHFEMMWASGCIGDLSNISNRRVIYDRLKEKIKYGSVDLDDEDLRKCLNESRYQNITFATHTTKPHYDEFDYVGEDQYLCLDCNKKVRSDLVGKGCSCKDHPKYVDLRGVFKNHTVKNLDLDSENRISKSDVVELCCNDCGYEGKVNYNHIMLYHNLSESISCELCNHDAIEITKINYCLENNHDDFTELFLTYKSNRIKSLKKILNRFATVNNRVYLNILHTADCIIPKTKKKIVYKKRAIYIGVWKQGDNICFGKYGISVNPIQRFEQQKIASNNCELITATYFYLDDETAKMLEYKMKMVESCYVSRELFEDGYTETFDLKNKLIYDTLVEYFDSKKDFEKSKQIQDLYNNIKGALL